MQQQPAAPVPVLQNSSNKATQHVQTFGTAWLWTAIALLVMCNVYCMLQIVSIRANAAKMELSHGAVVDQLRAEIAQISLEIATLKQRQAIDAEFEDDTEDTMDTEEECTQLMDEEETGHDHEYAFREIYSNGFPFDKERFDVFVPMLMNEMQQHIKTDAIELDWRSEIGNKLEKQLKTFKTGDKEIRFKGTRGSAAVSGKVTVSVVALNRNEYAFDAKIMIQDDNSM